MNGHSVRVGFGYDVHRLVEGRPLVLGGVVIPHTHGLLGHSDADVLLHALCDAALGASGLGDIGSHFPDSDPSYKGISSLVLLERVWDMIGQQDLFLGNADMTIVAQAPRLSRFLPQMKENICKVLNVSPSKVNIKATTTEGLGFTGTRQGIAAYAVVTLYRKAQK